MGWWTQDKQGHSFAINEGPEMVWGDGPADALDHAIDEIVKDFENAYGRRPTKDEMRAGLEFSLGGSEEVGHPREPRHEPGHALVETKEEIERLIGRARELPEDEAYTLLRTKLMELGPSNEHTPLLLEEIARMIGLKQDSPYDKENT